MYSILYSFIVFADFIQISSFITVLCFKELCLLTRLLVCLKSVQFLL